MPPSPARTGRSRSRAVPGPLSAIVHGRHLDHAARRHRPEPDHQHARTARAGRRWSPNGGLIAFGRGTGRARGTQESADDPFTSCTTASRCDGRPTDWDGNSSWKTARRPPSGAHPAGMAGLGPGRQEPRIRNANSRIGEFSEVDPACVPVRHHDPAPYSTGDWGDDPAFSPRGDAVAYSTVPVRWRMATTWYAIAVRNFAELQYGRHPHAPDPQATTGPPGRRTPSRIAFARQPGDIWVMNADGTNQQQVTSGSEEDNFPAWSPDGTKIAFVRCCFTGGTTELFTVEPDGTDVTRLTNDTTSEWDPDWKRATSGDPPGYPRAKAAMQVTVPLVPAYAQCQTPNREHGPPLALQVMRASGPAFRVAHLRHARRERPACEFGRRRDAHRHPGRPGHHAGPLHRRRG